MKTKIKILSIAMLSALLLSSCVTAKKYRTLETDHKNTQSKLHSTEIALTRTNADLANCQESLKRSQEDIQALKSLNNELLAKIGDLTLLTRKEAENLQTSLQKIREKDLQIKTLQDALTRKDSVTIALVTSLKGAIGIYDKDIEINVEKGVIFISISDKFLFRSGSYAITTNAKEVLGKVATILNDKPGLEVLVEGHTDNVPFNRGLLLDNWDLSVKRATALVRMLQFDFKVAPDRLIAAGRSEYIPVADNKTDEGRAKNRRTRIIILPKLEEFVTMIKEQLGE